MGGYVASPSRLDHNRDTLRRDSGNLAGACQKVIECLCIILPSFTKHFITFWHNSALAFIFGLMPIWEGMWSRCLDEILIETISEITATDNQVHARRSLSAYISSCHPIMSIQSPFDTIQPLLSSLAWCQYGRVCGLAVSMRYWSRQSQRLRQLIRCMPEGHWVLIYHPAIL